ncbi:zinc finger, C4 type, partial [Teladorsagia circumcincta]
FMIKASSIKGCQLLLIPAIGIKELEEVDEQTGSCKGFFRRVYLSAKSLECYRGNSCEITKESRNACRACRYKKCVQVGMKPSEIRGHVDAPSPENLPEMSGEISPRSSTDDQVQRISMNTESLMLPSEFSVVDEAQQLINLYLNLD